MVRGAAALSLRAASEIIGLCIDKSLPYWYPFNLPSIIVFNLSSIIVVSLHLRLVVYVVSTFPLFNLLLRLATALQRSTVSLAVDRYGRETFEESDRDFGQIHLPDYTIE